MWKSNLGTVDLELEFEGDVKRAYSVTPLHANIILYFEQNPKWCGGSKRDQEGSRVRPSFMPLVYPLSDHVRVSVG